MDDGNETPTPSANIISSPMQPASVEIVPAKAEQQEATLSEPVSEEPNKEEPEGKGMRFLVGFLFPFLVLLFLTNSSLLSAGQWDFNRRVELTLYSDDDGVFQFDADPKVSHGIKESVNIIFLDPAYTSFAKAYRPEIYIGVTWEFQRDSYNDHCEVESANAVCMYHLKMNGEGEYELTKLGEYDKLNHTAEFVLNGEANESIGVRIDYYDFGAEEYFYEVEQPRNQTIVAILLGVAFLGLLAYSALKKDGSLLGGVGTSLTMITLFAVLAFVVFVLQFISSVGG
jgi:hypothetical protein